MYKEIEIIEAREKRHSFSLKFKIDILQEYEADVKGKAFMRLQKNIIRRRLRFVSGTIKRIKFSNPWLIRIFL
jgi:hypothetical protein